MKTSHFSLYAFQCEAVGYLHVYVANGTEAKSINFDNLYITTMQGKTRQINHYYPFGLRMRMGQGRKYKNMYTGKELQTGEYWDASVSTGLEMYDFGSRFYDPALNSTDGFRQIFNKRLNETKCICFEFNLLGECSFIECEWTRANTPTARGDNANFNQPRDIV